MAMTARALANMLRTLPDRFAKEEMQEEFDEVGARVRDQTIDNFQAEQNSDGSAWEERKQDYAHSPLRETLAMYGAATVKGAPGAIQELGNKQILIGISGDEIAYARSHQEGDPDRNLPQREYLYTNDEENGELKEPLVVGGKEIIVDHARRNADR